MSFRDLIHELRSHRRPKVEGQVGFYFVTCRVSGDDEDSGFVVEAKSPDEAAAIADAQLRDAGNAGEDIETYTNFVLYCGTTPPAVCWQP
jgi:hypothetical protein